VNGGRAVIALGYGNYVSSGVLIEVCGMDDEPHTKTKTKKASKQKAIGSSGPSLLNFFSRELVYGFLIRSLTALSVRQRRSG
jgi:hypothetical protein